MKNVISSASRHAPALARVIGGLLLVSVAFQSGSTVRQAQAQSPERAPEQASAVRFEISAGPLGPALAAFGEASNLQVLYEAELARGVTSPGVSGTMTPVAALRRLLAGSGLTYQFTNRNTVTLQKPAAGDGGAVTLEPITVEGEAGRSQALIGAVPPPYAGGQVATGAAAGLLGNRDVMDTPFNVTSYTSTVIADQQARRITDVLENDPSVRISSPSDGFFDSFFIRGFPVTSIVYTLDGLPHVLPSDVVAPEIAERIEVFKGPTAFLKGMPPLGDGIGGAINIVPKRAGETPMVAVTGSYLSDLQYSGHVDAGSRFGPRKQFGVRFNGLYRDGDTPIDDQEERLGMVALGLDYRGERLRLAADLGYHDQRVDGLRLSITPSPGFAIPGAPKASSNPSQPWGFVDTQAAYGAVRGEFDILPNLTAHAAVGALDHRSELLNPFLQLDDAAGNLTVFPYYEPLKRVAVSTEGGLNGTFKTGPFKHDASLSASYLRFDVGFSDTFFTDFTSNLYSRTTAAKPDLAGLSDEAPTANEQTLTGIAVADVVSVWDDRIQLMVGVRRQQIKIDQFDTATGAETSSNDDDALSPSVGILFKPLANVALYANYIEGLAPGPTAPSGTTNAGEVFPPFKSRQYEAGVKVDFGQLTTTLSAFEIKRPNGLTDSASNTFVVDGTQQNRGLEFNIFGEPKQGFRVLGGATFIDGTLGGTDGGVNDGNTAVGVPTVQLNVGGEWDASFLRGLTFSGRVVYTSSQFVDAGNSQSIPDWKRFDIGARYRTEAAGVPVTVRAAVENLLDESYWSSSAGGTLGIGAPRTFLLSATARF